MRTPPAAGRRARGGRGGRGRARRESAAGGRKAGYVIARVGRGVGTGVWTEAGEGALCGAACAAEVVGAVARVGFVEKNGMDVDAE